MRTILLLIFIALNIFFILLATAYSSDWVYVGSDKVGDKHYLDRGTVRFNGPVVTFWDKNTDRKGEEMKTKYSIHCENKTAAIREIIAYSSDGAVLKSYSCKDKELRWLKIPPDSIVSSFYDTLCTDRDR
jgi:hypothetical protein